MEPPLPQLFPTVVVLPHRRRPTHPLLLSRPSLPPHTLALRQHPHYDVRTQCCPASERG